MNSSLKGHKYCPDQNYNCPDKICSTFGDTSYALDDGRECKLIFFYKFCLQCANIGARI